MKKQFLLLLSLVFSSALFASQQQAVQSAASVEFGAAMADIKATLGLVPTFMKVYPPEGLAGAWQSYKGLEMSTDTALSGKTKELIGLAVAAQIPCHYCIYAHTEFAKLNGATKAEIQEAIALSAFTREWSTYLNSNPQPMSAFQAEADAALAYMNDPNHKVPVPTPGMTKTQQEMAAAFGSVLTFSKNFSPSAVDGIWNNFKGLIVGTTALPAKDKSLIGFAVSSQVPCQYCLYFERGTAKLHGANEQELTEAAGMSALTRRWSTVLNGNDLDMKQFKNEIDQIIKNVKKTMPKKKS